jgi:hypothetical protein
LTEPIAVALSLIALGCGRGGGAEAGGDWP